MFQEGRYIGYNDPQNIQSHEVNPAITAEQHPKKPFDAFSNEPQSQHIEQQVHEIGVHKSRCHKPIILILVGNLIRIEKQFVQHRRILPGIVADTNGNQNDNEGDRHEVLLNCD